MRKIEKEYENPIDDIVLDFVDDTEKYFKEMDMTPNHITTLSLLTGCIAAYFFYKGDKLFTIFMLAISYYFDCMDGHYARKYKMETEFGDYYDHFSDIAKFSLVGYIMYIQNKDKFYTILPVMIILLMLTLLHLGCQEKIYSTDVDQPLLGKLKNICLNKKWINTTKYFGCGTQMLIFMLLIISY